jgi:DNA invertase Pin-like site-specific DNA recombinase
LSKKRKAYLYQRFSSEQQKDNSSIFRQFEHQTRWLQQNPDVEAEGEPWVDEALSGSTGAHLKHGQLGKLVQAIKDKEIESGSIILVEQFSRLSRLEVEETEDLLRKIWDGGITIVTAKNSTEYPTSTKKNLALSFQLMFEIHGAYMESEERSNRIKGSYDERERDAREDGITPKIKKPFWLDKNGKLNGKEVVIQDTFEWYKKGLGQQKTRIQVTSATLTYAA